MSKKHKKGFNPLDFTLEHGTLQVGYMGMTGIATRMPSSPQKGQILSGMGSMRIIPTMHGISGVFGSLKHLEKKTKYRR